MTCFEALEVRSDMIFVHVATIIIEQRDKEDDNSQEIFDYDNYGQQDKSKHKNDDDAIGIQN